MQLSLSSRNHTSKFLNTLDYPILSLITCHDHHSVVDGLLRLITIWHLKTIQSTLVEATFTNPSNLVKLFIAAAFITISKKA